MNEYVKYQEIINYLDINPGDTVMIGSDVRELAFNCYKHQERFDGNLFIDSIIKKLGTEGTLLFPTYNWGYCNNKAFDYNNTPSETGVLTNIALKRRDFRRTKHPIYSFAVWGKDKEKLCDLDNKSSFGADSPFAYLKENKAKMLIIGLDYQKSFTFAHYVEESEGVDYRYIKDFKSTYIDSNGEESVKEYSMLVRDLEKGVVTNVNPIGEYMEAQGFSNKTYINDVSFILIDLVKAYSLIREDIKYNRGKNLYKIQIN